jgi:Ti-type conjugative transfer relaxase TraA
MAIYHFSAQIISRADGRSAVASAAYRSAEEIHDQRIGQTFDYTRKGGVVHTEILAPADAPAWIHDRSALWNAVEHAERRKDAQLAREIEIGLPVELTKEQQVELLRDFTQRAFVSQGMVADIALHRDNIENPHAHLMLTTRQLTPEGFGAKRRDWNARAELLEWRGQWAELANEHLARAGLDIRIDHRTLEAQGIDLVPGRKLGLSAERQQQPNLPRNLAERVSEQREIAAENGRRIIEDPRLALQALTHTQATFTERDIAKFLHGRTEGAEQFQAAYLKVTTSAELVALGLDERGRTRFTTQEMVSLERGMLERAERLADAREHVVSASHRAQVLADGHLSTQQRTAFEHVTSESDLAVLVGVAGAGKSTMLDSARRAWEAAGYSVKGAALAGIAAENLETASGIPSRTLASWERSWAKGYEVLGKRDVLVIDEAGLVGTRQLARVLESADKAGAKVVLVGDPEQLQAIEAGGAFRGIAAQSGVAELTEVRRQKQDWQKEATQQLATGRTTEALAAYEREQQVRASPTREAARGALLAAWQQAGRDHPSESRLMLAYTRDDVRQLNAQAREVRQAAGELGQGEVIKTERGPREFAAGDRLYFLRNERGLGVKNGSLGTVERIRGGMLQIRMDGEEGRRLVVDAQQYPHLEHGYAATVHKAQGSTVDRTYVLATSHFDRHSTYVALSRHRESATLFYGKEDFRADWRRGPVEENFKAVLSRARPKELAHDYLEREPFGDQWPGTPSDRTLEQTPVRERAAELGQIERERVALAKSILEVSADLVAARRERARSLGKGPETTAPAVPQTLTAAERLRLRADQVAQRLAAEREQERPTREALERQQAEEQQRNALEQERSKGRELDLDRDHDLGL